MATIQRFTATSERRLTALPNFVRKPHPKRLVGLLLVLLSLIGGYFAVAHADRRTIVYSAAHDLSPGQLLQSGDIAPHKVSVTSGLYATRLDQVVGKAVQSVIRKGELLPISHIRAPDPNRYIAIPFRSTGVPNLGRGDRVDLWANNEIVARSLPVATVTREATYRIVTVAAAPDSVGRLIAALDGEIVAVKLP